MRITILIILFLSINSVFGQIKKVEYNEIIPKYIISAWENNGTLNNLEFKVTELNQIKYFFIELSKKQNNITSIEF